MKKKILLLSIIIFPSLIYFFFELTQANFKKMPYFGPKTLNEKGDTVYWSVYTPFYTPSRIIRTGDSTWLTQSSMSEPIDTAKFPVYVILFLDTQFKKEGYKLAGMYDYIKYKAKDISQVPIFVVSPTGDTWSGMNRMKINDTVINKGAFDSLKISLPNFYPLLCNMGPMNKNENAAQGRQKFLSETYFKNKPVHIFDYFMVLVDKKRHIRGYYDPSYNAEVKRMIDEYKHLKVRDEYAQTLKQNDIKQDTTKK